MSLERQRLLATSLATLLTSLPQTVASATDVALLYRGRWSVETLFQIVTKNFEVKFKPWVIPRLLYFLSVWI